MTTSDGMGAHGASTRTVMVDGVQVALHLKRYLLQVTEGPDRGKEVSIRHRVARIGKADNMDLVLSDPTVSRCHCQIEADAHGYRLRDLNSKNGLAVDGYRVGDIHLLSGASFKLGATVVRFVPTKEEEEVRFSTGTSYGGLLGQSLAMREVFATCERVAASDLSVLVEGESGTGKELLARALHDHSPRKQNPFVVFDLSAISSGLLESELFGHVKGAFTGAVRERPGAMCDAHGGTLFLDELGELQSELQPKLLRAVEEKRVRPVGGNRWIDADSRLVAATNRNLVTEVEKGHFRKDLYWRLAVIVVRLPSLRERPEDIPLLVRHFLRQLGKDPSDFGLSYETVTMLQRYHWPGNVRELRNFVQRASLMSDDGELEPKYLNFLDGGGVGGMGARQDGGYAGEDPERAEAGADGAELAVSLDAPFRDAKAQLLERFELAYWKGLLEETGGNLSEAARRAGVHRKSAEYVVRKLHLR